MKTLIEQVKERVSQLYANVVNHFYSEGLFIKCLEEDKLLFEIKRQDIDVFSPKEGMVSVIMTAKSSLLEDFISKHENEAPHFITDLEYWVDYPDAKLYLHNIKLNKPLIILDPNKEISVQYNFTSEYVGDKDE